MSKQRLFSYCIPVDDGAAPNPYWGICTLVICKPVIRRVAGVGDWITGTGSINSSLGDISKKVVYAMKITNKMTMEEYDEFCKKELLNKIPDWNNIEFEKMVGDCIYDFNVNLAEPPVRKSVHNIDNRDKDLGGKYALLSDHFYYFGNEPKDLPKELLPIIKQGQGHKSDFNIPYKDSFIEWIENNFEKYKLYGEPQLKDEFIKDESCFSKCSKIRKEDAENDEIEFWYENSPKQINDKLKKIRLDLRMTQKEFADKLNLEGVDEKMMKSLEAGIHPIDKKIIYAIEERFNISLIP